MGSTKIRGHHRLIATTFCGAVLAGTAQAQTACPVTHLLHDVQGSPATQRFGGAHNDVSPISATRVTVEGVVVASFQGSAQLRGFFMQEETLDEDGDPATSEGVFVSTGSFPPLVVSEGQRVCVTGSVSEYFGMTQLSAFSSGSIQLVADGNHLGEVTPAELTLPASGDVNDYYEQFEGMLVRVTGDLTIVDTSGLERFGEVELTSGPVPIAYTQADSSPTAAEYAAHLDAVARSRVLLDDDDNARYSALPSGVLPYPQPAGFGTGVQGLDYFRHGDVVTDLHGVVHWSWGGDINTDAWRIRPTLSYPMQVAVANPRPLGAPAAGNLRIANLNLGNFFATIDTTGGVGAPPGADSTSELDRQIAKLVSAMVALDADVIGVAEVENDGGYALQMLANRLNDGVGAGIYASVPAGLLGTGATAVGMLYDTRSVRPLGAPAVLGDTAFTNPNAGALGNAPALAQTFELLAGDGAGETVTVVVNQLVGRNLAGAGADLDRGDGQGPYNDTRTRALEYLAGSWLTADPTGQGDSDVLLIGTFHAYSGETPIAALRAAGFNDLMQTHAGPDAYSVAVRGTRGYVDHAFASSSLAARVTGAGFWHVNADEAAAFDYNDTQRDAFGETVSEVKPSGRPLYAPDAFRASDHDPVFVDLAFATPAPPPAAILRGDADGDGDIDRADLPLVAQAMHSAASGPDDPRDVDGNGLIEPADLRSLRSSCTRPHCATR